MTRNYLIITLIILAACLAWGFSRSNEEATDIEIYTGYTIYYVNGLTVTNEGDSTKLVFADRQALKEYIAEVTSRDITWY